MYERMLDKQKQPPFDEMITYCEDAGELWIELDRYLQDQLDREGSIHFQYGIADTLVEVMAGSTTALRLRIRCRI